MKNTGVFTPSSFWIEERAAAYGSTGPMFPENAASRRAITEGSNFASGISVRKPPSTPDFARPCGTSAVARFVHVSQTSIAAHGTPATSEFQTSPPP